MTVVVLTAVAPGLRGHLTRWLLEISPGVFVGHISSRVRELLWERVIAFAGEGRALMVYTARNEQRLSFKVHGHDWSPVDYDGISLMRRSTAPDYVPVEESRYLGVDSGERSTEAQGIESEIRWKRRNARRKSARKRSGEE